MSGDQVESIRLLVKGADEVVIAKEVEAVDFYQRFSKDGKTIVYFGTEASFEKWKREQVQ